MISKIVVGAGFGDEGKGTIVDYLAGDIQADRVVRFNGGAQTAHNVIHNGIHHTFSQWGSATLRGIPTYLGEHVLVDPEFALEEADTLRSKIQDDPWDLVRVHPYAVVVTPWHREKNKREEMRIRHGSCGMGIGVARRLQLEGGPTLRVNDLGDPRKILEEIRAVLGCENTISVDAYMRYLDKYKECLRGDHPSWMMGGRVVYEGAQGILLDETYGTAPHNTWTDCTPRNAFSMIPRLYQSSAEVVMVTRTYATRHGRGPFPSEDGLRIPEAHNKEGVYQGHFRLGHLDFQALRYSRRIAKLTSPKTAVFSYAVTHLDHLVLGLKYVDYTESGTLPFHYSGLLETFYERLGSDFRYASFGPGSHQKQTLY